MSQEREQPSGHGGVTWVVLIVLILVLYVLSVGPVAAVCKATGKPPPSELRQFYYPVRWLHDNTSLKEPLEAYAKLWGVH
jgi:hypothetical protein